MQGGNQRHTLVSAWDYGTASGPALTCPGLCQCPHAQVRCWSPDHTVWVCPGALWRSFLFFPSDAHKLLLISAVCSDSSPTSAPAGLVHTCFACLHEQKRLEGGFLLGSACWVVSQYSPCAVATIDLLSSDLSQACLASVWGAVSRSHAGRKALTEKHQKHRPGNISLTVDPW